MKRIALFFLLTFSSISLYCQYSTVGSATELNESCIRVTEAVNTQVGAAYFNTPVDLSQPFSYSGTMFFGADDSGADGMTFLLATDPTGQGMSGGGIGYQGIIPSFVVEFDTWQNPDFGDPVEDHLGIMSNGVANHNTSNSLVPPVLLPNIENNEEHCFTIMWDPATQVFQATLDDISITYNGDIAAIFPPGVPVYYGYTGSTGGFNNEQRVCLYNTSELDDLAINEIAPICTSDGIQTLTANLVGGTWGGAASSNGQIDPATLEPGTYPVTYTLGDLECEYSDEITIEILQGIEVVTLGETNITCEEQFGSIEVSVTGGVEPYTYLWSNGASTSTVEDLPAGSFSLTVTAANGCESISEYNITSDDIPQIESLDIISPICSEDNELQGGMITVFVAGNDVFYSYSIDGGATFQEENIFTNVSETSGTITVQDLNGCTVSQEYTFDGVDYPTVNIEASSTELCTDNITLSIMSAENETINWSSGETTNSITVDAAGTFSVSVTNAANCFTEAEIVLSECLNYDIPNLFTPNNDGTNDTFGLVTESENITYTLRIYSRWGTLVYEGNGEWDGNVDSKPFPADVLSYVFEVNLRNETIMEVGDLTLIR